jgi:hypothetical protein
VVRRNSDQCLEGLATAGTLSILLLNLFEQDFSHFSVRELIAIAIWMVCELIPDTANPKPHNFPAGAFLHFPALHSMTGTGKGFLFVKWAAF